MACNDHNDLCNTMSKLSVDEDNSDKFCVNEILRIKMNKIKDDYETIFSWNIRQLGGDHQNTLLNFVDKIRDNCNMIMTPDDVFHITRFMYKLLIAYELYELKNYKDAFVEIKNLNKSLEVCKFDESNEKYLNAFNHIAWSTYAYIASSFNNDIEKMINKIIPRSKLNQAEKSAICAIKAMIFMEYPTKGNDIALTFVNEARKLNSNEPEWIIIWLKAKGRVRRSYNKYEIPEKNEIDDAAILGSMKFNPRALIHASKVYKEVGNNNKNYIEADQYYRTSLDLIIKSIELAKDNIELIHKCLIEYNNLPRRYQSTNIIEELIQKVENTENISVDITLGKYYAKQKNELEKAKIYLSRAVAAGHFNSAMLLIKVDCELQSITNYSMIKSLNILYDTFTSPERRIIIISQILLYYYYFKSNDKEIMKYLKLYMDQDIDDVYKKDKLINVYPQFHIEFFQKDRFLNCLTIKIKRIINENMWNTEEKKVVDETFHQFNKMLQVKTLNDNDQLDDGAIDKSQQYLKQHDNWRKQKKN